MIPKMVPDFETFDSHEIKSLNILRVKRFSVQTQNLLLMALWLQFGRKKNTFPGNVVFK